MNWTDFDLEVCLMRNLREIDTLMIFITLLHNVQSISWISFESNNDFVCYPESWANETEIIWHKLLCWWSPIQTPSTVALRLPTIGFNHKLSLLYEHRFVAFYLNDLADKWRKRRFMGIFIWSAIALGTRSQLQKFSSQGNARNDLLVLPRLTTLSGSSHASIAYIFRQKQWASIVYDWLLRSRNIRK